jgi:hypothetical protein
MLADISEQFLLLISSRVRVLLYLVKYLSKIFKLFYIFKGFFIYFYFKFSSCILERTHKNIFIFLCIYY